MRDCPTLRWTRRLQLAAIKGGENKLLPFLIAQPRPLHYIESKCVEQSALPGLLPLGGKHILSPKPPDGRLEIVEFPRRDVSDRRELSSSVAESTGIFRVFRVEEGY